MQIYSTLREPGGHISHIIVKHISGKAYFVAYDMKSDFCIIDATGCPSSATHCNNTSYVKKLTHQN